MPGRAARVISQFRGRDTTPDQSGLGVAAIDRATDRTAINLAVRGEAGQTARETTVLCRFAIAPFRRSRQEFNDRVGDSESSVT